MSTHFISPYVFNTPSGQAEIDCDEKRARANLRTLVGGWFSGLGMERVMTRLEKWLDSTRLEGLKSSLVIKFGTTRKWTRLFPPLFCYWAKWNLVKILIYNAIATDKSKVSLQSPFLALTRESRTRTDSTRVTRITKIVTRSTPTLDENETGQANIPSPPPPSPLIASQPNMRQAKGLFFHLGSRRLGIQK